MIYVDSSVVLAYLLTEDRSPATTFWRQRFFSSRLLHYEVWTRIHALGLATSHTQLMELLLKRINLLEMMPAILARALDSFPIPVRTLDALHLASADFLRSQGETVAVASYDKRLVTAARLLGFEIVAV